MLFVTDSVASMASLDPFLLQGFGHLLQDSAVLRLSGHFPSQSPPFFARPCAPGLEKGTCQSGSQCHRLRLQCTTTQYMLHLLHHGPCYNKTISKYITIISCIVSSWSSLFLIAEVPCCMLSLLRARSLRTRGRRAAGRSRSQGRRGPAKGVPPKP